MKQNEFERKISEHRDSLYRMAFMYLGSEAEALKAVDEAVFKALLNLHKLRKTEDFSVWISRILINQCRQEIKQQGHKEPLDKLNHSASADISALPLKEAICILPQKLKEPMILNYFGNLGTAETASALKISKSKGSARLRRGISLLSLEIAREESFYEQK